MTVKIHPSVSQLYLLALSAVSEIANTLQFILQPCNADLSREQVRFLSPARFTGKVVTTLL